MLPERFKSMFGDSSGARLSRAPSTGRDHKEIIVERQSRGLDQFFFNIREQTGLAILDLGGAIQENLDFVTNLGHRVTTQAFLQTLDHTFGRDMVNEQGSPNLIESFLKQNLDFPDYRFDGVLLWDVLQYMSPALLLATVDELYRITRPGSYLLGYFHSDDKMQVTPSSRFRIRSANTISIAQSGTRKQAQSFNNRNIEKLFGKFESLKFFLTRENLREVIVRR